MRILAIAAGCLLLASLVRAECVTVEPLPPSSRKVRITALLDGKPLPNARLLFFIATEDQPRLSLSTDRHGAAATPRLLPGFYRVFASAPGNLHAELNLNVSNSTGQKTKSFVMDLTPIKPAPPDPVVVEKTPATQHVQEFSGLVVDPSGAPIPGAAIEVLRKGSHSESVVKLKSDKAGRFGAPIAEGTYVAFFQMPGFRTEIVGFKVARDAPIEALRVLMQIGAVC